MPSRLITPGSSARQRWRMPRLRAACAVACHGTNLTLTAEGRAANEARACGACAQMRSFQAAEGQTARLSHPRHAALLQPSGLKTRSVDGGDFASLAAGRLGRATNSPPQFGQCPFNWLSAHEEQKVHSNEQIRASVESGGRFLSQHSQLGRSCSISRSPVFVFGSLTPRLTGAGSRRLEGTNTGHGQYWRPRSTAS
jgi:hypothetical protein